MGKSLFAIISMMLIFRQLFIIDGVISLGVIVPQLFLLPDIPSRLKPNFMFSAPARAHLPVWSCVAHSIQEIKLARDRQPKEGRVRQGAFTRTQVSSKQAQDLSIQKLIDIGYTMVHDSRNLDPMVDRRVSIIQSLSSRLPLTFYSSQNIGYLPNQSMAFWFKAWNKIKKGSFTVPQISMSSPKVLSSVPYQPFLTNLFLTNLS